MRKGWEWRTLDQIATNWDKQRVPITKAARVSGEYPYYGASGIVDYVSDYIFEGDTLLISEDGANLLARSTPIAFPASGKYWVNNHAHVLRFENMATQRFVEYFLESIPLDQYVTGAAQPKLNQRALNSIPIPIPPLPEQQRIVRILDEAFAGLATAEANAARNLQNAREIFDSHLHAVFSQPGEGWVETTMGELIESSLIGLTRSSKEQSENRQYPYVKMNHITRDNRFEFSDYVTVDATEQEAERYRLEEGDFLFNTRNSQELVGKSCIYSPAVRGVVLYNNNIMRIRFRPSTEARFVLSALSSRPVVKVLESLKSGTTNVSAIYFKDLRHLPIPLPPLFEQKRIAAELDALAAEIQQLRRLYEQKQAALAALKKSLLHEAFSGTL